MQLLCESGNHDRSPIWSEHKLEGEEEEVQEEKQDQQDLVHKNVITTHLGHTLTSQMCTFRAQIPDFGEPQPGLTQIDKLTD